MTGSSLLMQLSHLPRFDHDWYCGVNRGPIGTIVSNLIRSYHILMSIMIIGIIVENFLAAKNFSTITTIGGTIVAIASDRMSIVTNRSKSYLILFLNCGDRGRPKHCDLLR